jgi:hypothetical protein
MTSTTARYPVKAKSLTLLELCQTVNELRQTSSRNTAQFLTRRLYLHPLTISTNVKQHSSKIIASNLLEIEQFHQTNLEKPSSPSKHNSYQGLSILSSSFPLTARTNTKLNTSISSDSNIYEASTTNSVNLPPINRSLQSSSSSKRSVSTRSSSYIPIQPKPTNHRPEKIDVWRHLAHTLQRPLPKDPPTTPLDILPDFQLENVEQTDNFHVIQQIQIYKRQPLCDSTIDENNFSSDEN